MNSIKPTFLNALLADASYVNNLSGLDGRQLQQILRGRMTPELAAYIADNFTVVSQTGGYASSFEATVWRSKSSNEIYVSMRGTAGARDLLEDAYLKDHGLPAYQLVDMVNWWLRGTAPAGSNVVQIKVAWNYDAEKFDFSSAGYARATGESTGVSDIKSVTGHSLGGYMATAFARIFGASNPVFEVNTFNSAGFTRSRELNIEAAFGAISALIGPGHSLSDFSSNQANFFAEGGVNVTTNDWSVVGFEQMGVRIPIVQEDTVLVEDLWMSNHFMFKLTDQLALGNAIAELDNSFDLTILNALVKKGSNRVEASYEGLLDALRRVITGNDTPTTGVGDTASGGGPQPGTRLDYHVKLNDLQKSTAFTSLQGAVTFTADPVVPANARNDFGQFLSLYYLTPFTMRTVAGGESALMSAHRKIGSDWAHDKDLTEEQIKNGEALFSDMWLKDRSKLLETVNARNEADIGDGNIIRAPSGDSAVFTDVERAISIRAGSSARSYIWFGDDKEKGYGGTGLGDHLYAGGGNDTLNGFGGNDHLEGNEGNDDLYGGDGNDAIFGGNGDDIIDGEVGSDFLAGGKGNDTYEFTEKLGHDVINDSDGLGSVVVNGVTLTGGKRSKGGSVYRDEATGSSYSKFDDSLVVTKDGWAPIIIDEWSDGELGIRLTEEENDDANGGTGNGPRTGKPTPPPPPRAAPRRDPLVLDLDGDGLELTPADGAVLFDHDADGIRTGTGWASADDGLLAWDRNGDGVIGTGRELFGVDTLKKNGQLATNGFDALSDLDSNGDGLINASDADFGKLRVWRDLDQDGVADAGELRTLAQTGIASISLNAVASGQLINNNLVESTAAVTWANATTTTAGAINFAQNLMAREFTGHTVEGSIQISAQAALLPKLRGSGMVRDISEAMSLGTAKSATLLALYQQLYSATTRDQQIAMLDALMTAWADTSTLARSVETSQPLLNTAAGLGSETALQAWARLNPTIYQHVSILERFSGGNFSEFFITRTPTGYLVDWPVTDLANLEQGFKVFRQEVYDILVVDTRLKNYLGAAVRDENQPSGFDTTALDARLASLASVDVRHAIFDLVELGMYAAPAMATIGFDLAARLDALISALPAGSPVFAELQANYGISPISAYYASSASEVILGTTGNDALNALDFNGVLIGGAGDDGFYAGSGTVFMSGGAGYDRLATGEGQGILHGDSGNDYLSIAGTHIAYGDDGHDEIEIRRTGGTGYGGTGNDSLYGSYGAFAVLYGEDGNDTLTATDSGSEMSGGEGNDRLRGGNGLDRLSGDGGNDSIKGEGGADTLSGEGGDDSIEGGMGDDLLSGGDGADTLNGDLNNDVIDGGAGNDLLDGGEGADVLIGGDGDDVYVVDALGDVVYEDSSTGIDTVQSKVSFKLGENVENLTLLLTVPYDDLVRKGEGNDLDNVLIGQSRSNQLIGGAGADTIIANGSRDTVTGGTGNDQIVIGNGSNTLLAFARGDGADIIKTPYVAGGTRNFNTTLRFAKDIWISDLTLEEIGSGKFRLVVNGGHDSLTFDLDVNDVTGMSRPFDYVQFASTGRQFSWSTLIGGMRGEIDIEQLSQELFGGDADDTILGGEKNDYFYQSSGGDDLLYAGDGNDVFFDDAGNDILFGGRGNDAMYAGPGINIVLGDEGNDTLTGWLWELENSPTDFFDGGAGTDRLEGRSNRDIYYFGRGSGNDVIKDTDRNGSHDVIIFGPGISPDDVSLTLTYENFLVFSFAGSDDSLRIETPMSRSEYAIQSLQFDNGVVWSLADLYSRTMDRTTDGRDVLQALEPGSTVRGGMGDDLLLGSSGADLLMGETGQDEIRGGAGNDTLVGGSWNDTLIGQAGSDVYLIDRGDGFERINDGVGRGADGPSNDVDEIRMNMNPSEVQLFRDGAGTLVLDMASNNRVYVSSWFDAPYTQNTLIVSFNDGTVWNSDYLRQHAIPWDTNSFYGGLGDDSMIGTADSDTMYGSAGNDTLDGSGGAYDNLSGGIGDDVYVYGRGYGNLHINDAASTYSGAGGVDTIRFKEGIRPEDISISSDSYSARVSIVGSSDVITFNNMGSAKIERLEFSDGTVMNPFAGATLVGNAGGAYIWGTTLDDTIQGGDGNDNLNGGENGNDLIVGGAGNDTLNGYSIYYVVDAGRDTLDGGAGDDILVPNHAYRFGRGDGQDKITSIGTFDLLIEFKAGVAPEDVRLVGNPNDGIRVQIVGTIDSITIPSWFIGNYKDSKSSFVFANGTRWDVDQILAHIDNTATAGANELVGTAFTPSLSGGDGNDSLTNRAGSMLLSGDAGNDTVRGGQGNDTLRGGTGNDSLLGGSGNDTFLFDRGDGQDIIDVSATATPGSKGRISFGAGITPDDIVFGGSSTTGTLVLSIRDSSDSITMNRWFNSGTLGKVQEVVFTNGTVWTEWDLLNRFFAANPGGRMWGTEISDQLMGAASSDNIEGFGGNDVLSGGAGDDSLYGDLGNDTLDGGEGRDWLLGGPGDDTYLFGVGSGRDEIADYDRVNGSVDRVLMGPGLTATNIEVRRNEADIILAVLGTDDELRIRWYPNAGFAIESIVFENGTIWTASQLQQMADLWAIRSGTAGNDSMIGTQGGDHLRGLAGNDTLDGRLDRDTLEGGAGDDTYIVESVGEVVIEAADEGRDQVRSTVSFVLSDNVEELNLLGTATIDGRGNAIANVIRGNDANNRLDGGGGADALFGGGGDDTHVVDNAGDVVTELAGGGTDVVESSVSWILAENIENLTLTGSSAIIGTGNALNNMVLGNRGNNTLEGGVGNDTLRGGAGADTYFFRRGDGQDTLDDANGDRILFAAGISSSDVKVSQTNLGGLMLSIIGAEGSVLIPGFFDNRHAVIVDVSVAFADGTVWSSSTLSDMVTNVAGSETNDSLEGTPYANRLFGLGGDDTLKGFNGEDTLDGGTGNDSMMGGGDSDLYIVDSVGDVVFEDDLDWYSYNDIIRSSVSYTLPLYIERLELTGTADINATGNSGNGNYLIGNSGNNILDGGGGWDWMEGGLGNDTYIVGSDYGSMTERENEGIDTIISAGELYLSSNVENLTLSGSNRVNGYGNELNNVLIGNSGANRLEGAAGNDSLEGKNGADTLVGGTGDDVYTVDSNDQLIELADEGIDLVQGSANLTLQANFENLKLTGTSGYSGTGNDRDNFITGNSGNNVLTGGLGNDTLDGGTAGTDTLVGGFGNDVFVVNSSNDVTTEQADQGTDTVQSTIAWTLGNNIENLQLIGGAAVNGTGNTMNNVLSGNSAANKLTGAAGNDTYLFNLGDGQDTIDNKDVVGASDTLRFGAGIRPADLIVSRVGSDLVISFVNNTTDKVTLLGYYSTSTTSAVNYDGKIDFVEFAVDGTKWTKQNLDMRVITPNQTPAFSGTIPTQSASQDAAFTYAIPGSAFTDPDAVTTLTYSATLLGGASLPSWLSFNSGNGTFSGTPRNEHVGNLQIVVTASDGYLSASGGFELKVANVNDAPVAPSTIGNQSGTQGEAFSMVVPAFTDIDAADVLSYTVKQSNGSELPSWLSFNASTRTLSGIPPNSGVGSMSLQVTAKDLALVSATSNTFMVTIANVNDAPGTGIALVGQHATKGTHFSYVVPTGAFFDVDVGDVLTYTATLAGGAALPSWLIFDATSLTFSGTPTAIGTESVTLVARDSARASVAGTFEITVAPPRVTHQVLNGIAGADTLSGGVGNDTLNGNAGNDSLVGGEGSDSLIGAVGNDTLVGGAGNDILDGGTGADSMIGGEGDDTYYVDSASDKVIEVADQGVDIVISGIAYTLGTAQERLMLIGSGNIAANGNGGDNILVGNSGNNTLGGMAGNDRLDGGLGADSMSGGSGNDIYVVDNIGDTVTEIAGNGNDLIESSIDYALGISQEDLTLVGTANISGKGNAQANLLIGNSGNNVLEGDGDRDTLRGGAGNDTLVGGAGADTYIFRRGDGVDILRENDSNIDRIEFDGYVLSNQVSFNKVGNNLEALINGTSDKIVVQDWYLGSARHVEEFRFSDNAVLSDVQVQNLVNAMAAFDTLTFTQSFADTEWRQVVPTIAMASAL